MVCGVMSIPLRTRNFRFPLLRISIVCVLWYLVSMTRKPTRSARKRLAESGA